MKRLKPLSSFLLLALFSCSFLPLMAQQNAADTVAPVIPKYWQYGGSLGLNFTQVSLKNWAGGGQSFISIGSLVTLSADYARGKSSWENRLDIAYGLIRQGENDGAAFRKTDDVLNVVSRYNYQIEKNLHLSALLDFRTQFTDGYDYKQVNGETRRIFISDFMAPGFLVSSLGLTYKKEKEFSLTLAPFSSKFTFVLNDSLSQIGAFGVEPGQEFRSELGAMLRAVYQKDIFTNVNLRSSLNLFGNYQEFSHIDVNWENILVLKVNKYINSTVSTQLIYDHDVIQKTQWRNIINVGFLLTI